MYQAVLRSRTHEFPHWSLINQMLVCITCCVCDLYIGSDGSSLNDYHELNIFMVKMQIFCGQF